MSFIKYCFFLIVGTHATGMSSESTEWLTGGEDCGVGCRVEQTGETARNNSRSGNQIVTSECPSYMNNYLKDLKSTGFFLAFSGITPFDTCTAQFSAYSDIKPSKQTFFPTAESLSQYLEKEPDYSLGDQAHSVIQSCLKKFPNTSTTQTSSNTSSKIINSSELQNEDPEIERKVMVSVFYGNLLQLQQKAQAELQLIAELTYQTGQFSSVHQLSCGSEAMAPWFHSCEELKQCSSKEKGEFTQKMIKEDFDQYLRLEQELNSINSSISSNSSDPSKKEKILQVMNTLSTLNPLFKDIKFREQAQMFGLEKALQKTLRSSLDKTLSDYNRSLQAQLCYLLPTSNNACKGVKESILTISQAPTLLQQNQRKGTTSNQRFQRDEANSWIKTSSCLIERALDRNNTEEILQDVAINGSLLFPGFALARLSLKAGGLVLAGRSVSFSQLAWAGGAAMSAYSLKTSLPEFANACTEQEALLSKALETSPSISAQSIPSQQKTSFECPNATHSLNIARASQEYKRCLIASVFVGLDLIPLAGPALSTWIPLIKKTNQSKKTSTPQIPENIINERRGGGPVNITPQVLYGKPSHLAADHPESIAKIQLPPSMSIKTYTKTSLEKTLSFEKAIIGPNNTTKIELNDLPIDPLTKTIDANFQPGREFVDSFIMENKGEVTALSLDLGDLGYVSKNFSGGKTESPKKLSQISRATGDRYLIESVNAIQKSLEESGLNGFLARMGGDEFLLVVKEKDKAKIKDLMKKINDQFDSLNTAATPLGRIFREEKLQQKKTFQTELSELKKKNLSSDEYNIQLQELSNRYKNFATHSHPSVSVGATRFGDGENIDTALNRSTKLAADMKISTKDRRDQDLTKYRAKKSSPKGKIQLRNRNYEPAEPADGIPSSIPYRTGNSLTEANNQYVTEMRGNEIYRIGNFSIREYHTLETGKTKLKLETYTRDETGFHVEIESLYANKVTGIIDGRHERGQKILSSFIESHTNKPRSIVWVNVENLGMVNYFKSESSGGDQLLKAVSDVIQKVIKSSGLPIKLHGSEFCVVMDNIGKEKLKQLSNQIQTALKTDPTVHQIYNIEVKDLQKELSNAQKSGNLFKVNEAKKMISEIKKVKERLFTVQETMVEANDSYSEVMKRLRRGRYPQEYSD